MYKKEIEVRLIEVRKELRELIISWFLANERGYENLRLSITRKMHKLVVEEQELGDQLKIIG